MMLPSHRVSVVRPLGLLLLTAAVGVLPTCVRAQVPPVQLAPGDIYKASSPSVVLIETYGEDGKVSGSGSGFIVSADGRILTNFHVIAHSKRATVRLANEDAYDSVDVLDVDKRKDIALLKIKAVNQPFVKLGRSSGVYTLGNPLGAFFQNTLSDGILSGVRQMDGYKLFQLSAPISHGSSGSPVFNSSGDVIAIVEATFSEGQNLNLAIPIDYAAGMMGSAQARPLEAFYEPEEPKTPSEPAPSAISSKNASVQPAATANPSQGIKSDPLTYLASKVGVWTKEDAELELGAPIDRRDAVDNYSVIGDIYKYFIPYSGFATIELNINRVSKKLTAAYFYGRATVSWQQIKKTVGKNYIKQKMPDGHPAYYYKFGNRTYCVLLDSTGNVFNIGVW